MIFVTVGSQKFQFNRLLEKTDQMVKDGIITEEVFMQTGASDYVPRHCRYQAFYNCDEFSELMEKSDVVITHGGTGTIIKSVKMGKKTIVIPRLARYGEHVDDHQLQLLERFREKEEGEVLNAAVQMLEEIALDSFRGKEYNSYVEEAVL